MWLSWSFEIIEKNYVILPLTETENDFNNGKYQRVDYTVLQLFKLRCYLCVIDVDYLLDLSHDSS